MIESLNYRHIHYFWMVAKQGSITKASSILNVSQSSISEQIKVLEHNMGVQLFVRSKKGVELTEYGKRIYSLVNEFFPKLEELFESLINHKSSDIRFLNIGLAPTLSSDVRYEFCYPFIEDIHYTVKINRGENSYLKEAFEKRELDIVLTTNRGMNLGSSTEKKILTKKKIVFVVRPSLYKKISNIEDVSGHKFINYTADADLHFNLINYLNSKSLSPLRIAEIDDILLVKEVLQSMDCFAALPLKIVETEIKKGKLRIIDEPPTHLQPELTVFYRKDLVNKRFEKLLNIAEKKLKKLFT